MSEDQSSQNQNDKVDEQGLQKLTSFGEPLWVDALKSIGAGLVMLLIVIVVGGALGVAIIAPWGRASHDCSIYCVIDREFGGIFLGNKPK